MDKKFWEFKNRVIDLIPDDSNGFLDFEAYHADACIQVAALAAAASIGEGEFIGLAIDAYRAAKELLEEPEPIDDHPPLTVINGGKQTDGPRRPC